MPALDPDPQGGWQLTFWMGSAFDYAIPFRSALIEMANLLGCVKRASIQLPAYEPYEDFVEGTLQFGDDAFRIYYEHALGYLSLSTDSREVLRDVAAHLSQSVKVV